MTRRRLLLAALALSLVQIGFVVQMIVGRAAILRDGATVRLSVEPVDPRDLLRGDYVRLGYAVSRVDPTLAPDAIAVGNHVVVGLSGEPAEAVALTIGDASDLPEGTVPLRGIVQRVDADGIDIVYGIERFYVPEGRGRDIEEAMAQDRFEVELSVADDGSAQIRALLHEGRAIYSEPVF